MKNKTTYEMEDVMNLLTKDLAEKGLAPDVGSIEVWAHIDEVRVSTKEIEIEVNVSWVGIPLRGDGELLATRTRARGVPEPDADVQSMSQDLLDEAPSPRNRPTLVIGDIGEPSDTVEDITAASTNIARSGGAGLFAPDRVRRRLSDDESTEWPGSLPTKGR